MGWGCKGGGLRAVRPQPATPNRPRGLGAFHRPGESACIAFGRGFIGLASPLGMESVIAVLEYLGL